MEKINLSAEKRKISGKKVKTLRDKGFLPAVIYGHDVKPTMLMVKYGDFEKVYKNTGGSKIISLVISGEEQPKNILIHDIEVDPLTHKYLHADFYQIKMTEKITAEVPLHFVGEAIAVSKLDGVMVKNFDNLEVECLPGDLPSEIEVDISVLETFDDMIHIKDLKLPEGIKVLAEEDEVVVTVSPPRTEEELAELEEKEEVAEEEAAEEEAEEGAEEEGGEQTEESEEAPAEGEKESK